MLCGVIGDCGGVMREILMSLPEFIFFRTSKAFFLYEIDLSALFELALLNQDRLRHLICCWGLA